MDKEFSEKNKLYVKVPGTSANLGPGFDIFGLALDIYNEFYFELGEEKNYELSLFDETPLPFPIENNLIKDAYLHYFKKFLPNQKLIPFDVKMKLNLPIKGGLGSSASALVAGFSLAKYVHENFYVDIRLPTIDQFLYELAVLEGHPDNTSAAYIGGFVFSFLNENRLIYFSHHFPNTVDLVLFIPDLETETNHSRKKLPQYYSSHDVIFNLSRVVAWMEFLQSGRFDELSLAVEDKVHTPYRIRQLPFLEYVSQEIQKLGGCFTLSGSGPSLLIFLPKNSHSNFIQELRGKISTHPEVHYKIFPISPSTEGTTIQN